MNGTAMVADSDLRKFAALIRQKTGMVMDEVRRKILETRLEERIRALALPGPAEYYDLIWFGGEGPAELKELIDAMLINETLFYRNNPQMEILEKDVFPALIRRRISDASAEPIRVWSAGCSTGAEAFSVVMAFEEARTAIGLAAGGVAVSVLGTDISTRALAAAVEAVYSPRPVENAPPPIVSRYFTREKTGYRVADSVRRPVSFRRHNLLDSAYPEGFDLIFCRNVMIYFDAETREKVVEKFYRALNPDGFIFIGHTETLLDWPEFFRPRHSVDAIYYEKWSTDRRAAAAARGTIAPAAPDRRRPVEEKSPPAVSVEERPLTFAGHTAACELAVKGVLDANCPRDVFKERMLLFLAKRADVKVIDLADVPFVSNEFIRVLRQALAVMKSEGVQPFIVCPPGDFLKHFQAAALDKFSALVEDRVHLHREITASRKNSTAGVPPSPIPFRPTAPPQPARPSFTPKKGRAHVEARCDNGEACVTLAGCLDSAGCDAEGHSDISGQIKQAVAGVFRKMQDRPAGRRAVQVRIENATCVSSDIVTLLSRAAVLAREYGLPFRVVVDDEKILRFVARHLSRADLAFKLEYDRRP
ncbi:MAG: hypothetical protein A3G34_00505 [Candidatus Lindowbacteria bacterium RIFCSPLOWO2_12_FULL_62_27]|nr:MAG: hypothetical protein A3G34_00505 [Candidatus Lindowbacteria bacterium RIFCSPLOWO2_12_FULL_62_27]